VPPRGAQPALPRGEGAGGAQARLSPRQQAWRAFAPKWLRQRQV